MSQLTFVFRSAPHSTSAGREGVDALLAASAYCEDITVLFIGDGVTQLVSAQDTSSIQSKNYLPMFKLFDLYDIESVYVCEFSLKERGLAQAELVIDAQRQSKADLVQHLQSSNKVLTF
ncbi:putative tRNA 5-methylaminomethyl-2-thiouridine synthase TusC [Vibrio nigripulchritudo POn4]|uniref:sulfurtransferase complex subunit TusC n=1 Tax=Vibrio nigripulchritudo TaxID=28173 RepID=UPI0003B23B4E|nr:sulfurtransferase complex subunit TusC [Vibrio nigripulchritudo]CCN33170.1 putative tRNA 5-methylaminomethyl-2-thiouridine synthase TusC [Vibrio nigripulchritudo AM115]CCN42787.1 putative tRNA 5-methylaminomethyl-2-thiouridine synthase TusC [Vibrio nigripulchritudo FTn2]CCN67497.1 putative tRNA 5-methylaminomethyl-2-thiouridine synthase TusC [Vibrio nigripulchritudo POn4]